MMKSEKEKSEIRMEEMEEMMAMKECACLYVSDAF